MLYFVGVGPGDAELLTLKAARILEEAAAIAVPDSGKESVVWSIAGKWMAGKPLCRLPMPMRGNRQDWENAHARAAEVLLEWLKEYETIAYPVLGDPGIYASSSYLLKKIAPLHPCQVIPGVPAMCAVAAQMQIPLCEQAENLHVLDHLSEGEEAPEGNVVIMKAGKNWAALEALSKEREIYLGSNVGRENQWIGTLQDVGEELPYFTTAIIK